MVEICDPGAAFAVTAVRGVEGRTLLQLLQDGAEMHAPRCAHMWRDHDVLVWDNASVQHEAGGNLTVGEPRRFWRYMVAGARPA